MAMENGAAANYVRMARLLTRVVGKQAPKTSGSPGSRSPGSKREGWNYGWN